MTTKRVSGILAALCAAICCINISGQATEAERKELPTPTPPAEIAQSKVKVVFDDSAPGIIYIESNGQRLRVDAAKRTVEDVTAGETKTDTGYTAKAPAAADDEEESPYDFDKGEEPYDFRIVNVPTPRSIPKKSWNLAFTHRFSETLDPLSTSAPHLFGLDSFGIASFGLTYGFTDKLYGTVYRSPLCQKGLCRTIEIGVGYNWLSSDKDQRIALATYASVEGNDNFTEEFTYNLQARIAARLGKRVYLFFSPAVHINSNGQGRFDPRPTDFFPPAPVAATFRLPTHGTSFGFGGTFLITPNVVALVDFVPRAGFKLGRVRPIFGAPFQIVGFRNESYPSFGFGVQRNVGKHAFALTFSNTQATTTSRYNSSNVVLPAQHLIIGFNLTRRF